MSDRHGARRTRHAFLSLAVAVAIAACATTPPPEAPEPEPTAVAPMGSLSGVIDDYAAGAASIGAHLYDFDMGEYVAGSSGGTIDAAGAFALDLVLPPSSALDMISPDEFAELYGECFTVGRTFRNRAADLIVYTGDLPSPTVIEHVWMHDAAAPEWTPFLYFTRPVGGDTVDVTIRLPLTTVWVTDSVTLETTSSTDCGDTVVSYRLSEGWNLWSARTIYGETITLPNGDDLWSSVVLAFEITDTVPDTLRFVLP